MSSSERAFWNQWNAAFRDVDPGAVSRRQAEVVHGWLAGEREVRVLDAGCGSGWLTSQLTRYGTAVGTDLADEVIERARERGTGAEFVAGDIMTVDVGAGFDVVVTLEVLSHVADQSAFLRRCHDWLRPGGQLLLATQNRSVLERWNQIPPPGDGQLRRWVDRRELLRLVVDAGFVVDEVRYLSPVASRAPLRHVAALARRTRTTGVLERCRFGWTVMLRATRPTRQVGIDS